VVDAKEKELGDRIDAHSKKVYLGVLGRFRCIGRKETLTFTQNNLP